MIYARNDARRDKAFEGMRHEKTIPSKRKQPRFGGNQPGLVQVFHKFPRGTVRIFLERSRVCFKNETNEFIFELEQRSIELTHRVEITRVCV